MAVSVMPSNISFKFLDGPKIDQDYTFSVSQSPIKIGRSAECEIKFDDNSLSRYQCTIDYNQDWILRDGFSKPSTNGTWLFVEEPFPLTNGTLFKAGQTLFQCQIIKNI